MKMPDGQESANLIWTFIKQTRSGTTDFFTPKDIYDWEINLKKCLKNNIEVIKTEEKVLMGAMQVCDQSKIGPSPSIIDESELSFNYSISDVC